MSLADPGLWAVARWIVAGLFTGALIWASVTDIRIRKIRNVTVLTIIALFAPWAILSTGSAALSDVEAGVLALALGVALYATKAVGAGDAKLFAAVSLFVGLRGLPELAIFTALAGGALAAIGLALRPNRAMVLVTMRGKGDFGRGVPYGVAISVAAAVMIWAGLFPGLLPI